MMVSIVPVGRRALTEINQTVTFGQTPDFAQSMAGVKSPRLSGIEGIHIEHAPPNPTFKEFLKLDAERTQSQCVAPIEPHPGLHLAKALVACAFAVYLLYKLLDFLTSYVFYPAPIDVPYWEQHRKGTKKEKE